MAVDRERLTERLAAVERRLTDADPDEGGLADVAAVEGRLSELETRADELDDRLGDVESGLQALRGYVGGVDAVDESVERRADAALARVERLEATLVDEPDLAMERVPTDDPASRARDGTEGPEDPAHVEGGASARIGGDSPAEGEDIGDGSTERRRVPGAQERPAGRADGTAGTGGMAGPAGVDGASTEEEGRRLVDRLRDAL
ncbi:MAG: hypothetical protein ABEJ81_07910 [Haloferacaceae archaeon]